MEKNYVLTDFTKNDWSNKEIDFESIKKQIEICNSKNHISCQINLDNEILKSYELNDSTRTTHIIKNLKFEDKKITGDVKFLDTQFGKIAEEMIKSGDGMFGIDAVGTMEPIEFLEILAWNIIKTPKNENNNNNN